MTTNSTVFYESSDCSGAGWLYKGGSVWSVWEKRLMARGDISFSFVDNGGVLHYAWGAAQDKVVGSYRHTTASTCYADSRTLPIAPESTVDTATWGFVPPFHLEL